MTLQPLNVLDELEQRIVRRMLSGVVDHPEVHSNGFQVRRISPGQYEYYINRHSILPSPVITRFLSSHNIAEVLVARGYALTTNQQEHFTFTQEALDWYRQFSAISDQDIQHRIGLYLLTRFHNDDYERGSDPFDWKAVAAELHAPLSQLLTNARLLNDLKYVDTGPYTDRTYAVEHELGVISARTQVQLRKS